MFFKNWFIFVHLVKLPPQSRPQIHSTGCYEHGPWPIGFFFLLFFAHAYTHTHPFNLFICRWIKDQRNSEGDEVGCVYQKWWESRRVILSCYCFKCTLGIIRTTTVFFQIGSNCSLKLKSSFLNLYDLSGNWATVFPVRYFVVLFFGDGKSIKIKVWSCQRGQVK